MKSIIYLTVALFVCIELFGCHDLVDNSLKENYAGTYLVKRNTEIIVAGTWSHVLSKDSFFLEITKKTASKINFSTHNNWTATMSKNSFFINPYETKQTFGILSIPVGAEITGFGKFSKDSILYIENINAGFEIFSGKTLCIGVKQ